MAIPLLNKYKTISSCGSWPAIGGLRFAGSIMADFDGDGRDEVLSLQPTQFGPSLGVLSYYNPGEIASGWATPTAQEQLIGAALAIGRQSGGWTPPTPGLVAFGPIRDAGGIDLLIVDPLSIAPMPCDISLVRWECAGSDTSSPRAFNAYWTASVTIPGPNGQAAWLMQSTDQHFVSDIDGDGVAEVVFFNGSSAIGVAKWKSGALVMEWVSASGIIPGATPGYSQWGLASSDMIAAGDIDGDGKAELVLYDGNQTLCVVRWSGSGLTVNWITSSDVYSVSSAPNWRLVGTTHLSLADLDGDGKSEVIAQGFLDGVPQLGAFHWTGTDLRVLAVSAGAVTGGGNAYSLMQASVVAACKIETTKAASIVMADLLNLAIISWNASSNSLQLDFSAGTMASPTGLKWSLSPSDRFAFGDYDGDGIDEIFVQSDPSSKVGLLKWSGGQIVPLWVSTPNPAQAQSGIQSWGIGLIYQAPATPFMHFQGKQLSIYQHASQTLCGPGVNDIRSQYTNTNETTSFASWRMGLLDAAPSESGWAWMSSYASDDINAVFGALETELLGVANSYGFNSNSDAVLKQLAVQRSADLKQVIANMQAAPSDDAEVGYWIGQIFEAALWAAAAISIEGLPVYNIVGGAVASMFGSLLGSLPSDEAQGQIQYKNLNASINNEYDAAHKLNDSSQYALVQDPIKLEIVSTLLETAWQTTIMDPAVMAAASSPYNRNTFYSMLLSKVYALWNWPSLVGTSPQYWTGNDWDTFSPPGNASWSSISQMQYTNVFVLAQSSSSPGYFQYPTTTLTDDLFSTGTGQFGFSVTDFLAGRSPLNMHINTMSNQSNPIAPAIYITNSTDQPVWITIYLEPFDTGMASGNLGAGQAAAWNGSYAWGSFYKVRGQVNGGTPDTSIGINPQLLMSPHGYAVNLVQSGDSFWWEKAD